MLHAGEGQGPLWLGRAAAVQTDSHHEHVRKRTCRAPGCCPCGPAASPWLLLPHLQHTPVCQAVPGAAALVAYMHAW